ncbi:MAG: hypothetical protein M8467_13965 [Anaerolineae bacterium]|nr:hypothetical protein [Anaerolineae bacterium]
MFPASARPGCVPYRRQVDTAFECCYDRSSARAYADIIRENAITPEIVSEYAPELAGEAGM